MIIEFVSPGTAWAHDLNTLRPDAKPRAYAECGVAEYLVCDPLGITLPERVRAWRYGPAGTYEPWLPAPDGRWHSQALGISFAPEQRGVLLRVYTPDGRLVPTSDELARELRAERSRIAEQAARIADQTAHIAALEAELRRRDG